ncbi:MAG: hypothetical protein RMY34_35480 [Aulosira sp. DedQUE10]|nr:hypothetical protein [Aulosira sp. DedQUE10]
MLCSFQSSNPLHPSQNINQASDRYNGSKPLSLLSGSMGKFPKPHVV